MPKSKAQPASLEVLLNRYGRERILQHKELEELKAVIQKEKQDAIAQAVENTVSTFKATIEAKDVALEAKDAAISNISQYYEALVTDLSDKTNRDPKTQLLNLGRFMHLLEAFLSLDQREPWCAVGLVDITNFKRYNDTLGHDVGDKIIERVAQLMSDNVGFIDLLAHPRERQKQKKVTQERRSADLHARFGGDEFCFLVPDLDESHHAYEVAERFHTAVERHDWTAENELLATHQVQVDIGVVCLQLGQVKHRRFLAKHLASDILQKADKLMYAAKEEKGSRISLKCFGIENGQLIEISDSIQAP